MGTIQPFKTWDSQPCWAVSHHLKCVIWFSRITRNRSLTSSNRSLSSTFTVLNPSGLKRIWYIINHSELIPRFWVQQKQCEKHINACANMHTNIQLICLTQIASYPIIQKIINIVNGWWLSAFQELNANLCEWLSSTFWLQSPLVHWRKAFGFTLECVCTVHGFHIIKMCFINTYYLLRCN